MCGGGIGDEIRTMSIETQAVCELSSLSNHFRKFNSTSIRLLTVAIVCLFLVGCLALVGTPMPKNLREHGIVAKATVLTVWDTGILLANQDPVIGMRVEVQPPDRAAFQATIKRYMISPIAIPQFQPGKIISIRFDPKDPTVIAVDD